MKNLGQKILAVMTAVTNVEKDKKNAFHNYQYASDEAIVAKIRMAMIANKLICIPNQKSCIQSDDQNQKGERIMLTILTVEYTLTDVESGEQLSTTVHGYGRDKEDKGVYKAATGAEKYYLLKTFLIPTGDDPESDNGKSAQAKTAAAAQTAAANARTVSQPKAANAAAAKPAAETNGKSEDLDYCLCPVSVKQTSAKEGGKTTLSKCFICEDAEGLKFYTFDEAVGAELNKVLSEKGKIIIAYSRTKAGGNKITVLRGRI